MKEEDNFGVVVDRCDGCGSIWFDRGEMTAYLEQKMSKRFLRNAKRPEIAWEDDAAGPACPRCEGVILSRGVWNQTEFRACRQCRGALLESKALLQLTTIGRSGRHLVGREPPKDGSDAAGGVLDDLFQALFGWF